jgi:hypothetical protein
LERKNMEQIFVSWDTYEITKGNAEFLQDEDKELSEEEAFSLACGDSDLFAWEWDHIECEITLWLKERDYPSLLVEGHSMGWRGQSGCLEILDCSTSQKFLSFLPKSDCTFTIYEVDKSTLRVENSHHDAPTGEGYLISVVDPCIYCSTVIEVDNYGEDSMCGECEEHYRE